MQEIWKDIKGYEGYYQVSNFGRIKSSQRKRHGDNAILSERLLKPTLNSDKYFCVKLYRNGNKKSFKVHELVASSFIDGKDKGLQINHIDGIKTNNCYLNLEWITQTENIQHAMDNGLNGSKKYFITKDQLIELLKKHNSLRSCVAEEIGCSVAVLKYYLKKYNLRGMNYYEPMERNCQTRC